MGPVALQAPLGLQAERGQEGPFHMLTMTMMMMMVRLIDDDDARL